MAAWDYHEPLFEIVTVAFRECCSGRFNEHRYRAELIEWKEPWSSLTLDGQRRFEFRNIFLTSRNTVQMRGELVERNRIGYCASLDAVKEHLPESCVQWTGNKVIGLVGANLFAGLGEVGVIQIINY